MFINSVNRHDVFVNDGCRRPRFALKTVSRGGAIGEMWSERLERSGTWADPSVIV